MLRTSEDFMTGALEQHFLDINTRLQIQDAVNRLCSGVETKTSDSDLRQTRSQLDVAVKMTKHFASRIESLQEENSVLEKNMDKIKESASTVRDKLAVDISQVLIESRRAQKIQHKVKILKEQIKEQKGSIVSLKAAEEEYKAKIQYMQEQEKKKESRGGEELDAFFSSIQVEKDGEGDNAVSRVPIEETKEHATSEATRSVVESSLINTHGSENIDSMSGQVEEKVVEKSDLGENVDTSDQAHLLASSSLDTPPEDQVVDKNCCLLRDIEDVELLHVFSFLDTAEVLSAAQANRYAFQRVDELFGLDSKVAHPDWSQRRTPPLSVENDEGGGEDDTLKELDDLLNSSGGRQASKDEVSDSTSTSEPGAGEAGEEAGGVANYFNSFTASIASHIKPAAVLAEIDPETAILPEGVLALLAAKLSSAEMAVVVALNDKAQSNMIVIEEIEIEKDDVQARLLNAETVRDFLVSKLKSAEMALKASLKECAQYRRQAAADGEVISFLDLKSQDLQGNVQELDFKRQQLQAGLNLAQGTNAHAERSLRSELTETRNRLEEGETSFKNQKKLLVKEVKSLRTTVERVSDEKRLLSAQLSQVRDVLGNYSCSLSKKKK